MRSTIAIDVAAPPDLVFALSREVTRWDRLLPHYARSRAVIPAPVRTPAGEATVVVDFVARRALIELLGLGLPVAWRARTWADGHTRQLRFIHVAGATKGMDVTWRIEPSPAGCRVSIEHVFAPRIPLFARLVDRGFTRPIAGRTLATFKALAEILATDAGAAP